MPVQTRPEAKIGPEELAPNAVPSVIAYPPSGGDDTEAVEHAYESLGEPGIVQLKPGHYKFDKGVKFRKNAVYLKGAGAATMEVESKIVTAGTLITCNSLTASPIECSQAGSNFSDFALLNNAASAPTAGAGINITRLNEKGEEKTEGNSRGRYWNLDIEGFFVNWKAIAGFEQRFQGCSFTGGVKYQFQYGDPNNTDAGGLFVDNCSFLVTKKRKVAANFRWESGGGVFINNCSFLYNPESLGQIPAIQVDFFFEPPAKHGTSNLTVNACHIEGYENAGVRFFCSSGESVTLGNCAVTGCELRPFTAVANRVGVLVESPASEHLTAVTITGNRFSTEGGSARLKNVNGYNYAGNTGHVAFTLEGSDAAGSGTLGYPSFPVAAVSTTMNVSHAGGNNPYWLFIYLQLKPGELAEYQLLSSGYLIATIKEQAAQPLIYGYCEAIAGGEITEIKTKALIFSIPSGANIKVVDFENSAIFTEFKTTAEAKVGETKILVEKKLTEAIPAPSPVEALAPEKYEIMNGPFFMPPTAAFELKRLDTNTYTVKTAKVIAP